LDSTECTGINIFALTTKCKRIAGGGEKVGVFIGLEATET